MAENLLSLLLSTTCLLFGVRLLFGKSNRFIVGDIGYLILRGRYFQSFSIPSKLGKLLGLLTILLGIFFLLLFLNRVFLGCRLMLITCLSVSQL